MAQRAKISILAQKSFVCRRFDGLCWTWISCSEHDFLEEPWGTAWCSSECHSKMRLHGQSGLKKLIIKFLALVKGRTRSRLDLAAISLWALSLPILILKYKEDKTSQYHSGLVQSPPLSPELLGVMQTGLCWAFLQQLFCLNGPLQQQLLCRNAPVSVAAFHWALKLFVVLVVGGGLFVFCLFVPVKIGTEKIFWMMHLPKAAHLHSAAVGMWTGINILERSTFVIWDAQGLFTWEVRESLFLLCLDVPFSKVTQDE